MDLRIVVEVKPFVKKYIAADYPADPFWLSTSNPYGIFLHNLLQKPNKKLLEKMAREKKRPHKYEKNWEEVYSDQLVVEMTASYWETKGCIITREGMHQFNRFVTYLFYEECFKYVRNGLGKKDKVKDSILKFAAFYNIGEDEFAFRTMERMWFRRYGSVRD